MPNAFANRAGQNVIRPIAGAGFFIRGNVRRDQPWHILIGPSMARAFSAHNGRCAWLGPIGVRVTTKASIHAVNQVFAASQASGGRFKFPIRQSALLRADQRTPTDRESDTKRN